ncbi:MAG: ArsR/SmtB family transcription factor [Pleomorphochaeta sp.]
MELTTIIKIFSDQTRLRIINLIKENQLCVGEIQTILEIKQSNVSRHLDKLKIADIINQEKKAQWVYYSLNKEKLSKYSFIQNLLFKDINNYEIYNKDIEKLKKYKNSNMCCQDLKNIDFDINKIKF